LQHNRSCSIHRVRHVEQLGASWSRWNGLELQERTAGTTTVSVAELCAYGLIVVRSGQLIHQCQLLRQAYRFEVESIDHITAGSIAQKPVGGRAGQDCRNLLR
jgi:hypothetical protein